MLELKGLTIDTVGGKRVVTDASLSLAPKGLHILMGPNGSGKSSLLSAVMGHPKYRVASGSVVVDGEDVTGLSTEEKARHGLFLSMQYVPEIPGVTLTNFLHRAYQALGKETPSITDFYARIKDRASALGIDPAFAKRELNAGFSGGEKKMSELLQLALLSPKYAFLDEIDSGVDVDALKTILAGVERVRAGGTGIVLVTHYPNILTHVTPDRVSVMKEGRIVREGGSELVREIVERGFGKE